MFSPIFTLLAGNEILIQNELTNEPEIRRFLLSEMAEEERIAFEERFIADEDLFEQTRVVEDELIESYIRNTLSVAEKEKFERLFLSTESRRQRVAFTRKMLNQFNEHSAVAKKTETAEGNPPVWNLILEFFKTPKFAFGAVFTLLLLTFGGWFLLRNPKQTEVVQQITPPPTIQIMPTIPPDQNQNSSVNSNTNVAEKIPDNKNSLPNANKTLPNKNQNTNKPAENLSIFNPMLALFAGNVRSEGKMPVLNLPKNALGASLQLNLESQDYKIYQVEIIDADGNPVLKNNRQTAKGLKINIFAPAKKLRRGDYLVKVSALNPQNEIESVADYSFRVIQK